MLDRMIRCRKENYEADKLSIKLSIYKSGASHKEMEYVLFT